MNNGPYAFDGIVNVYGDGARAVIISLVKPDKILGKRPAYAKQELKGTNRPILGRIWEGGNRF